ncbi:L-lactate permease [Nitriliruptoraceae bacterium ZYF776]|nr:L-lactate permease [Profundirhabdus halotolerans]
MGALLAAVPIVVVLVLMVGRRWPASRAGAVGAALALGIALVGFDLGRGTPADVGTPGALGGTLGEALFTSATILWIVLPALAIHHLQVATGATERLRIALGGLAADPRLLALLIGWFFALFVEGAAGFGASVALAAPFLVGVGYRPLDAVVVAMLGHAIGVSFGAIGTPLVPQVAATGLRGIEISGPTARLHLAVGGLLLVAMVLVASRAVERPARGAIWGWTALAGVAFLVPYWAIAEFVGPELPTLGGALLGAGIFVVALRLRGAGTPDATVLPAVAPSSATPPIERTPADPLPAGAPAGPDPGTLARPTGAELVRAAAPYLVLIAAVLLTRLVPAVRDPLRAVELAWELPGGFRGSFLPLSHPGTLLVVAFLGGALWQRVGGQAVVDALRVTVRQLGAVTVALVTMLTLARTMVHAGMTQELAAAAAAGAGAGWPVLAPLVGVLGTFVTGSATASNVLFTDLQTATADALTLPVVPMQAAQGFGAAVGNIVCPHNIVAAGATVGLTGGEGEVLRRTLLPAVGYALAGGLVTLLIVLG